MADNVSIDTGLGLKANRKTFATDETNSVHTIRTSLSSNGTPIDADNPLPVGDADVLAQLIASNEELTDAIHDLQHALTTEIIVPILKIVTHLELITDTNYSDNDVED